MDVIGDTKTKIGEMSERMRERKMEGRIEDLDRENVQLRTELRELRGELAHERSMLEDALEGLRDRPTPTVVKKKRRGGLIRTVVIGGGAYLLGTRAGRERYDQIMGWVDRKREEMMQRKDEMSSEMASSGSQGGSASTGSMGGSSTSSSAPSSSSPTSSSIASSAGAGSTSSTGSTSSGSTSTPKSSTGSSSKPSGSTGSEQGLGS